MAEYCLDCFNHLNQSNENEHKYIISKYPELCEGCGKMKPIVIAKRGNVLLSIFCYLTLPIRIVRYAIYFLSGLMISNHDKSNDEKC